MQNNRWLQTLLVLLVIIASLYLAGVALSFIGQFSSVILLFFLSWLLAFILRPFARMLNNRGLSYGLSVLVVYLTLALAVTLAGFLLIPAVTQQISELIKNFDSYVIQGQDLVNNIQNLLIAWGVSEVDITAFYKDLAGQIQTVGLTFLNNVFALLQSVATFLFQLIIVLLLSFYFMKDGEQLFGGLLKMLPPRWQDEVRLLGVSFEKSFGAFVRGQLLFALIYALLNAGVMFFFGLDYVVLASIVAGLCMLVPLIGNYIAYLPPVLVALVMPEKADMWAWVLLAAFIVQTIQMNVVGPRIMSQAIGIHPLYVMAAILAGGQVAGFWGALFGIPIAGTINLVGRPLMRRIRFQSSLYEDPTSSYLTTRQFATGPLKAADVEAHERREKAKVVGIGGLGAVSSSPHSAEAETETTDAADAVVTKEQPTIEDTTRPYPRLSPYDYDLDEPPRRATPTLAGRFWRLAWLLASRAYKWIGVRAHVRRS